MRDKRCKIYRDWRRGDLSRRHTRARARASRNVIKNSPKNIHRSNKALVSDRSETDDLKSSTNMKEFHFTSRLNAPLGARKWADARCIERHPPCPPPSRLRGQPVHRQARSLAASPAPDFSDSSRNTVSRAWERKKTRKNGRRANT